MSTHPAQQASGAQSREEQLLNKLLQKTLAGKLRWIRQGSAITARTSNALQVDFILAAQLFGGPDWVSLTVRDGGAEVLKVEKPQALLRDLVPQPPIPEQPGETFLSVLAGLADRSAPLRAHADKLFAAVLGRAEDDLSQTLKKLDQL